MGTRAIWSRIQLGILWVGLPPGSFPLSHRWALRGLSTILNLASTGLGWS